MGCKDIETDPSHLKYVLSEYIWDAVEEISKELLGHTLVSSSYFEYILMEIVPLQ